MKTCCVCCDAGLSAASVRLSDVTLRISESVYAYPHMQADAQTHPSHKNAPSNCHTVSDFLCLAFFHIHTKGTIASFFLFFPLRNLTPTHSMYTEGNRTALYAFTHSDSFSDYGMSQIPVFQTVACKCVTDHISQSNYAARDT